MRSDNNLNFKRILRSRIIFILIGLTIAWCLLVARAAHLQILPNSKLANLQKRQYSTVIDLPARRGLVSDRHGKELAVTIPSYSVFADPKIIEKRNEFARVVGKKLRLTTSFVKSKIKNKEKRFVWIKRQISTEIAEELKALKLKGLGLVEESKRVYPNEHLLSQIIGFVGKEGQGLEGLEKQFDSKLRGEDKKFVIERDARGRPLLADGRIFADYPAGYDLALTIDSDLQFKLEKELANAAKLHDADSATGVVMDPRTGEILAMANYPTFNLNAPQESPQDYWRNRTVTDGFEPGSTMKTFVIAAALKSGIAPSKKYFGENGRFKVGKHYIKEADANHAMGMTSVSEILAKSSNVGTAKIALELGDAKVRETLTEFGFGKLTNIDLPGEKAGILHKLPWHDHLLANISIGQGVRTTPLQMAAAYASIANGGMLMRPYVVRSATNAETGEQIVYGSEGRQVLSEEHARTLRLILHDATSDTGSGKLARVPGFPIAGKTGTAQRIRVGKGYVPGEYISSFAGFIPANDPRFVIYVAVDNPKAKYYGAEVAAPIFSKVGGYAVRKAGLQPVLLTENSVIKKSVETTDREHSIQKIRDIAKVLNAEQKNQTPDFLGLTLREVLNRVRGTPMNVQVSGRGVVSMSIPAPGEPLPEDRKVRVYLGPAQ